MKKLLFGLIGFLFIVLVSGCFEEVNTIEFINAPQSVYTMGADVSATQFKVRVNGDMQLELTNSLLVVQGLTIDKKINTSTVGSHTITITYKDVTINFQYLVEGEQLFTYWDEQTLTPVTPVGDIYTVNTASELAWIAKQNNTIANAFLGKTIELGADINLGAHHWIPIGIQGTPFKGSFDGKSKTVSNIRISLSRSTDQGRVGLFGDVLGSGTTIKNININSVNIDISSSANVSNAKYAAGLAGRVEGNVSVLNVHVSNANIKSHGYIGGIVGYFTGGLKDVTKIAQCSFSGTLTAYNPVVITSSDGEGDKVAGIVGSIQNNSLILESNVVSGVISGTRGVGGITGSAQATTANDKVVWKNNYISPTTVIQAIVEGGSLVSKESCNAGGIVGTLYTGGTGSVHQFENNQVLTTNIIATRTKDSNTGKWFGGLRSDATDKLFTIIFVGAKTYNITLTALAKTNVAAFRTMQAEVVDKVEDETLASGWYNTSGTFVTAQPDPTLLLATIVVQ